MIIGPRVHYGPRAKALGPLCTLRADYHVPARLSRVLTSIYMQCILLIQAIFLMAEVDLGKKWLKSRRIILFQMTSTFMTSYNQHALDPALATTSLSQGRKYQYERRLEA